MDWFDIYTRLRRDANDGAAWAALESRIGVWARRTLGDRGTLIYQDAIADTCAAVVLDLDRARSADTFAGFVYGQFLTVRRRALRRGRLPTTLLDGLDVAIPEDEAGPSVEQLTWLRAALERLPRREQQAVLLRYMEEASAAQIARQLGTTPGNARRLVCIGLGRLRRQLAERRAQSAPTRG
jgi:RNA polymerase sigma factor (sigma-70 family)